MASPTAGAGAADAARALSALRAGGVEELLDASFAFYRRRFFACFGAMALVQVPVTLGLTFVSETALRKIEQAGMDRELISQGLAYTLLVFLPSALLSLAATHVGAGALTYLLGRACTGQVVGVVESYRWAFRRVLPLLGTAAVVGAASIVGLLFFVVPGVVAFLVSFAAVPAVMLEDRGIMDGLRRSYVLATDSMGRVAAARGIMALFLGTCLGVGYYLAGLVTDRPDTQRLLAQVPTLIVGPVDAISMVLLYYDLRVRREGLDLETLAASLETK